MFIGTHAFLPVLAASAINAYRVQTGREKLFAWRDLILIGLTGCLPDLLSPHISLNARLTSWTHNIWFLIASLPVLALFTSLVTRQNPLFLGVFLWAALALHLFVDMGSGGISPFYPIGTVLGFRIVPFRYWFLIDLLVISLTLLLFYWIRRVEKAKLPK